MAAISAHASDLRNFRTRLDAAYFSDTFFHVAVDAFPLPFYDNCEPPFRFSDCGDHGHN